MTAIGRQLVSGLVALGVALAVLAGAASSANAAWSVPVIGVGEQKPGMFASRPWQRLGLRHARYTAPWDALQDPVQLALLDAWMSEARRAGVHVLLGFAHSLRSERLAHTLPSRRQYERQFKRFRARYPWVRDWLGWDEAKHPDRFAANPPRRATPVF